jgi:hypothetical protein
VIYDTEWLAFYRSWSYDQLLQEIEVCHKYQLQMVERLGKRVASLEITDSQIRLSQHREATINEVIREKVAENVTKTNSNS